MKILVTGSEGFLGRNLCAALKTRNDVELSCFDKNNTREELNAALDTAELIYHLAGVNRPQRVEEFKEGNTGLTGEICEYLKAVGRKPAIIFSSSIQALRDNPYGQSKMGAEQVLHDYAASTTSRVVIHRFSNLFGKWSRPNYNTVTATFCYNIARDLPIQINDPSYRLDLSYVDDVVEALLGEISLVGSTTGCSIAEPVLAHNTPRLAN
jgi:UDP-2-acetamido-2,6-beta-L-arabino-hexul-4-ose reductase